MDVKVTKKQNVKVDGVKYVPQEQRGTCLGCAFDRAHMRAACNLAPCTGREDSREVIFVLKADQWIPIKGVVPKLDPNTRIEWRSKSWKASACGPCFAGGLNWAIGEANEVTHYRVVPG